MNEDQLRISDAERDQAAAALGEHFAQGRLTADEHTERLDRIWAARTRGELRPIFRDLPGSASGTRARPDLVSPAVWRPRRGGYPAYWSGRRRGWPVPIVPVLAVLVLLTILTHIPFVAIGLLVLLFVVVRRRVRRV